MVLPALALAWLLAIATVGLWDAPGWLVAAWLVMLIPGAARLGGRRAALWMAGAALVALAGGLRFQAWYDRPAPALLASVGSEVALEGVVAGEPDPGETTVAYRVDVWSLTLEGSTERTDGAVLARFPQYTELLPGDRVRLQGKLEAPENFAEGFDYRAFLASRGVVGTMFSPRLELVEEGRGPARWLTRQRLALERALQRSLPEPEASLAAGIAFGRDDNLPREVADEFRATGLAHIVAVSGSNVALVTAVVFVAFTRFVRRQWALLPALAAVVLYLGLAGFSMSVVRAAIMAAVLLVGMALGRPRSSLAALAAAVMLMTFVQPSAATDVGFQLSVAATGGLIVFGPWVTYGLERAAAVARAGRVVPGLVFETTALSISATVATLPISWFTFGRVSLIGVVANIVVEPLFPFVFFASAVTAVAGAAWEPAGWLLGLGAYYLLASVLWVAEGLAGLPLASVGLPGLEVGWVLLAYAAMAAIAVPAYRYLLPVRPPLEPLTRDRRLRRTLLAGAAGMAAVAVIPVSLLPAAAPGELRIDVLDVGQGDAILVTTPGGARVLIDGGPSGIALARELSAVLPHWQRRLDVVVLTHPQLDHVGGLPAAFERYDVREVRDAQTPYASAVYALYQRESPVRRSLARGDRWEIDGVLFEVLWPEAGYRPQSVNDASIVLRVVYEGVSILLPGDIEANAQRQLMASGAIAADILKVPHHGSKSNDRAFLDGVGASLAVISVGAGNPFGHPTEATLAALADTPVLRTDLQGRLRITVNDGRIAVRSGR